MLIEQLMIDEDVFLRGRGSVTLLGVNSRPNESGSTWWGWRLTESQGIVRILHGYTGDILPPERAWGSLAGIMPYDTNMLTVDPATIWGRLSTEGYLSGRKPLYDQRTILTNLAAQPELAMYFGAHAITPVDPWEAALDRYVGAMK